MQRTLSIAIVGAGLSGLATAGLLAGAGHDVTVFDPAEKPRAIGAGLMLSPAARRALIAMGVFGEALSHGTRIERIEGDDLAGNLVRRIDFTLAGPGTYGLAINRGALFELLRARAEANGARFEGGAFVLAVDQQKGARDAYLRIEGARQAGPYDLVVDAAGGRSPLTPLRRKRRVLGHGTLWAMVELAEPADMGPVFRTRSDRGISAGILPLGTLPGDPHHRAALFWSLPVAEHQRWLANPIEDWKTQASAAWPDLGYFIEGISCHEELAFAVHPQGALAWPVTGRVLHIGDAAHPGSPFFGRGADHALIDAVVLASALERSESVPAALRRHVAMRATHLHGHRALGALGEAIHESDLPGMAGLRRRVLAPLLAGPLKGVAAKAAAGLLFPQPGLEPETRKKAKPVALQGPGE